MSLLPVAAKVVAPKTWPVPRLLGLESDEFELEFPPPVPLPGSFDELELLFELDPLDSLLGLGLAVTIGVGDGLELGLALASGDALGLAVGSDKTITIGDGDGDGLADADALGEGETLGLGLIDGLGEGLGLGTGLVQPLSQLVDHNSPCPGWPGRWSARNI